MFPKALPSDEWDEEALSDLADLLVFDWGKLELNHLELVERVMGNRLIKFNFIIETFHCLLLTRVLMRHVKA